MRYIAMPELRIVTVIIVILAAIVITCRIMYPHGTNLHNHDPENFLFLNGGGM